MTLSYWSSLATNREINYFFNTLAFIFLWQKWVIFTLKQDLWCKVLIIHHLSSLKTMWNSVCSWKRPNKSGRHDANWPNNRQLQQLYAVHKPVQQIFFSRRHSAPSCDHFGRHGEWKKYLATKILAKVANWRPTD